MKSVFQLLLVLILVGCYPTVNHRGFNPENIDFNKIKVNVSNEHDVLEILGSPTIVSSFPVEGKNWSSWYYIQRKTEQYSFWSPKTLEQLTVHIKIDHGGVVRSMVINEKENGEEVVLDKNRTPSTGYQSSALRDVFGNFAKYAKQKQK